MDGQRLKEIRKKRGYTQVALAEALNVSKGSVAMWETGKRNPEFETLNALLSLLDVSFDYLSGNSDDIGHNNPTEDEQKQIAAWAIEDEIYEAIRSYLSLDMYGQAAVDSLIKTELVRCRDQQTLSDVSAYKIAITIDKDKIDV